MSAAKDHENPTARRNHDGMLHELGRHFGWHRRTQSVNEALYARLRTLDTFEWFIERDYTIPPVAVPFILLGPTGVFLLMGSRGYWTDQHVIHLRIAADTLTEALEGYPDPVHPAIVLLEDEHEPRQEYAGRREGPWVGPCWVLGDRWLTEWLHSYEDLGFSEADISRLREESDPARTHDPRRLFMPANEANGLS